MAFKSGFVAIVGRPNVGKSTLLNQLLGQKVAIATSRVQTTRHAIQGVLTVPGRMQAVLIDTPGFSKALDELGETLVSHGQQSLSDADIICLVVDMSKHPGKGDEWLAKVILETKKPAILLMNKVDVIKDEAKRKHLQEAYLKLFEGAENDIQHLAISAKTGKRVENIKKILMRTLPKGDLIYDPETVTTETMRKIAEEMIREKALRLTKEEIPHCVAIQVEEFDESNPKLTKIRAVLYVEKKSQKPILIGQNAQTIKKIGEQSRKDIEEMLETQVFLDLTVKVKENWRKNKAFLKSLGLLYE